MSLLILHGLYVVWGLWAAAATLLVAYARRLARPDPLAATTPPILVIVPIKGAGPGLAAFLGRARAQSATNARIAVVVESRDDPAYAAAVAAAEGLGLPVEIVIAGRAPDMGQKVWNLLAGLKHLRAEDEIVAFLDADTMPGRDWLLRLVGPLVRHTAEVTSGYRWLVPVGSGAGGMCVAAIDHAIATMPRWRHYNIAWGGSCALRRQIVARIDLPAWWRGAISDDAQITRALWANGLKIVCPPGLLVPSLVSHNAGSAYEFGRRQYVIIRTHLPWIWIVGVLFAVTPLIALAAALAGAASGDLFARAALIGVLCLDLARFALRRQIDAAVLADAELSTTGASFVGAWLAGLAAPLLNVACLVGSLSSRRVRWAGIDYDIRAPQSVAVTRR